MKNKMAMIKIKTIYGKVLTIKIEEQTKEYISGLDKFGVFVKVPKKEIENSMPINEENGK